MREKGLSSVFSVVLLIAITVAAGVLLYMWATSSVGTYAATPSAPMEFVSLVWYDASDDDGDGLLTGADTVSIKIRNEGTRPLAIEAIWIHNIKHGKADGVWNTTGTGKLIVRPGEEREIRISLGLAIPIGKTFQVRIVTTAGSQYNFVLVAGAKG